MALQSSSTANHNDKELTMESLHDRNTICNKEGMMLSLTLSQALDELEQAREEGDEQGEKIMNTVINMILEQVEPIEE